MTIDVITPRKIEFQGEVKIISLPTFMGQISILEGHAPLISVLKPGRLRLKTPKEEFSLDVEGGVFLVSQNKATLLLKDFNLNS